MAKGYGVKVSEKAAEEIKINWREKHPNIVKYWADLENAARYAVINKGQMFQAGAKGHKIKYKVNGSFLWCLLPSGRALCYPYPQLRNVKTPWGQTKPGIESMTVNSAYKWEKRVLYGGLYCENVVQAVARDLLVEAMLRLEIKKYTIVMHVHDEIISEVDESFGSLKEMEEIMSELPTWAVGLPVSAAGYVGARYQK